MIDKNKLYKIYDAVLDNLSLTKDLLDKIGIDEEELNYLLNKEVLKEVNSDEYQLLTMRKIYSYALELRREGNTSKAIKYFQFCHKLYPYDRNISLNLLLIYIRTKDVDEIYNIFSFLDITEDEEHIKENNLILLLLKYITKVPEEYKERINSIKLSDIIFQTHTEYQNISSQNQMRKYIFENKFIKADTILRKELNKDFRNELIREIISTLLTQIIESDDKRNIYIRSLIDAKNYSQLVSFLEKRHQIRKLNLYEAYVYKISSAIVRIKEVNKIPKVTKEDTTILKEAIIGNNYKLALQLISHSHTELSNSEEKEIVIILLKEINQLITNIIKECQVSMKKQQEEQEKNFLLEELEKMKENDDLIIVLDNIDEKRIPIIIQVSKTIKNISVFTTGYKKENITIRRMDKSISNSNTSRLIKSALNAYINGDYQLAISIYRKILLTETYIKADICGMLGLSYFHLNDIDNAIKYMNISMELDKGHRENRIDYKTLVKYLKEPQTEQTTAKINAIVNKHDSKLIDYDLTQIEELAYYITTQNIEFDIAIQTLKLSIEQIQLIKLVYARDYFIEGNYPMGDKLVTEVAEEKNKTLVVISFLTEVRRKRIHYKQLHIQTKKTLKPQ